MSQEFALDLRLARRKAGLTQRDCAHLLGIHKSRVSALERGRRLPTIAQICTLSLIYGRSFESLFEKLLQEARKALRGRIPTLPELKKNYVANFNRAGNVQRLEQRLNAETENHGRA